jgi:hypothetical protein
MLLLGAFIFADFEIPERLSGMLSGKQMLAVKKQIGGQRVIDAMGPDPTDPAWSGRFQGGDVVSRASQIAAMRDAGQPVVLVCDSVVLTVVIAEFNFDYERPWQATYDIRLIVQPDDTDQPDSSLDDLVGFDLQNSSNVLSGSSDRVGADEMS